MASLEINPRYRTLLNGADLVSADQFLALPGVIICGHPDRNVSQVTLGTGADRVPAYLKREHRVPWRDRLASMVLGLGLLSKSQREARVLRELQAADIGCPEWIAAGEDDHGRAFLLVRELTGARELHRLLQEGSTTPLDRRLLVGRVGVALAQLHDAGFDHPDLHSRHLYIDPHDSRVFFLDCQRVLRRPALDWRRRWRNLAVLDATLTDALVSTRERLACLRAYLRATLPVRVPRDFRRQLAERIRGEATRLLRHRYLREIREARLPIGVQNLIALDGEALCVTREFRDQLQGKVPECLVRADLPHDRRTRVSHTHIDLPGPCRATLTWRRARQPLRWLWSWLRRRPLTSPEMRQAGVLFRLQRHGVETPRLLAVGQRHSRPWCTESFLLTEVAPGTRDLTAWLAEHSAADLWTAQRKRRWQLVRAAAVAVRSMHTAHCYLGVPAERDVPLLVQPRPHQAPAVLLRSPDSVRCTRHPGHRDVVRDLAMLRTALAPASCSRTDQLRFLLAYLDQRRLTTEARRLLRSVLAQA